MAVSTASSLADALIVVETAGTLAFALSGLIEAARKRLDASACAFVAGLTAFAAARCATCCSTAAPSSGSRMPAGCGRCSWCAGW
jgi:hypothetical protein